MFFLGNCYRSLSHLVSRTPEEESFAPAAPFWEWAGILMEEREGKSGKLQFVRVITNMSTIACLGTQNFEMHGQMIAFSSCQCPKEWEVVRWRNGQTWFCFFLFLFLYPHRIWGKTYLGFFCVCATTLFYEALLYVYPSTYVVVASQKYFLFSGAVFIFGPGNCFSESRRFEKNFRNDSFQNSGRKEEETEIGALWAPRLGQQLLNAQGVLIAWLKIQVSGPTWTKFGKTS